MSTKKQVINLKHQNVTNHTKHSISAQFITNYFPFPNFLSDLKFWEYNSYKASYSLHCSTQMEFQVHGRFVCIFQKHDTPWCFREHDRKAVLNSDTDYTSQQ